MERIFQVANELAARGEKVTQNSVRDAMGGGSFTTIQKALKEWREANPMADAPVKVDETIPEAVTTVSAELGRRVWAAAKEAAGIGLEAARRELEEARKEAAEGLAEANTSIETLEAENERLLNAGNTMKASFDAEVVKVSGLTADLAGVRAQLVTAQEQQQKVADELTAVREVAADRKAEIAKLMAEKDASAQAATKADKRAENAEKKRDEVQAQLTQAQADLGGARADLATERAQHVATRSQLGERLERVTVDLEQAEEARDQATARNAELLAEVEALKIRISKSEKDSQAAQKEPTAQKKK